MYVFFFFNTDLYMDRRGVLASQQVPGIMNLTHTVRVICVAYARHM